MKFKLHKSDKSKQAAIRKAVQCGLPLAGLLASAAISAGCSEKTPEKIITMGEIQATENRQHIRGDIGPVEPVPPVPQNANQPNEKDSLMTRGKPAPPNNK